MLLHLWSGIFEIFLFEILIYVLLIFLWGLKFWNSNIFSQKWGGGPRWKFQSKRYLTSWESSLRSYPKVAPEIKSSTILKHANNWGFCAKNSRLAHHFFVYLFNFFLSFLKVAPEEKKLLGAKVGVAPEKSGNGPEPWKTPFYHTPLNWNGCWSDMFSDAYSKIYSNFKTWNF